MCGICGYIGDMPKKLFEEMLVKNESRGGHAWGWAYLDEKEKQFYYHKQPGKFKDSKVMAPKTRLMIAHTRFATHGKPEINENNHPHINTALGVMLVHNGVVSNKHEKQETECDSEAILKILIDQMNDRKHNDLMTALRNTSEKIDGSFRLGVLHVESPDLWVVCDSSDPVYFGFDENYVCFASEEKDIPDECAKMHALGNRVYKVTPKLTLASRKFQKKNVFIQRDWSDWGTKAVINHREVIKEMKENKWVSLYCKECRGKVTKQKHIKNNRTDAKDAYCYQCRKWIKAMEDCSECPEKNNSEYCNHTCDVFRDMVGGRK